jgi:2-aminoadipate transaminase
MQNKTLAQDVVLAGWASEIQPTTIQQILAVATRPEITSFALGLPSAKLFPTEAYAQASVEALSTIPLALQYGPPWQPLKRHIVRLMAQRGVSCREEQVFLTTGGAQQAMSLLSRPLLEPHGTVLVEETIYSGILQAVKPLQPHLLTVPTDADSGIDIDAVSSAFAGPRPPAFLYAISDGHNPLGGSLSLEKRRQLVELARHYRVPILEDDAYGFLGYEQEMLPPLKALDDQWVFYLGSFSKILAPSLRTGWIVLPEQLIPALEFLKEGSDINTATLAQRTIAAYLDMGQLPAHLALLRHEYKARRDVMLQALQTYFPPSARWHVPQSGMFIWVEIPDCGDMNALLKMAIEKEHVAFLPGQAFSVNGSLHARHCMRLNFSCCSVEDIEHGMARLARLLA